MTPGGIIGCPLTVNHDDKGAADGRSLTVTNDSYDQHDDPDRIGTNATVGSPSDTTPNDRLRPENIGRVKRLTSELLSKRSVGT